MGIQRSDGKLKAHFLQHTPSEGLGTMEPWLKANGYILSQTALYSIESSRPDLYPSPDSLDLLIILGGPMSVYEQKNYPWMIQEFQFIEDCLKAKVPILGICLGAQILAHLLGGIVKPHLVKEIGWFPVTFTPPYPSWLPPHLPEQVPNFFHWHGDTFTLPSQARRLGSSEATLEQGFQWGDRVIALQFHGETNAEAIEEFLNAGANELIPGPYIQTKEKIRAYNPQTELLTSFIEAVLTYLRGFAHL